CTRLICVALSLVCFCMSCNAQSPSDVYTLSLHDALPISHHRQLRLVHLQPVPDARGGERRAARGGAQRRGLGQPAHPDVRQHRPDRKSTRLNSSHVKISYAVFCLKKKTTNTSKRHG